MSGVHVVQVGCGSLCKPVALVLYIYTDLNRVTKQDIQSALREYYVMS